MKNKVSGKDYQPIRFHRGRPQHTPPGKTGQESDSNEDETLSKKEVDSSDDTTGRNEVSYEGKKSGEKTLTKKAKLKSKKNPAINDKH